MTPCATDARSWTAYVLAGGAALALPAGVNAAVMLPEPPITIVNQNISLTVEEGSELVEVDVDADGRSDFGFYAVSEYFEGNNDYAPGYGRGVAVIGFDNGVDKNQVVVDKDGYPVAYGQGQIIFGFPNTAAYGILLGETTKYYENRVVDYTYSEGNWPNDINQPRYLGVLFEREGAFHTGWIEVATELGSASFNITRSAFVTAPNTGLPNPIPTPTPEPSSMALMLLGAAGVATLKRRRSVN